jgi:CRP-like cAMP-binding protein
VLQENGMPRLNKKVTNELIDSLPAHEREKLLSRCTQVDWKFGDIICEANQVYQHVYFPLGGFVSLLTLIDDHPALEMGLVGNEGMLGVNLVLGANKASMQSIVQGTGSALAISAEDFRQSLLDCPSLSTLLLRYINVLLQQLTVVGACLHFHSIESRMSRWLLMTQDRTHGDRFYLTHAFLANMLGVRRSSVSLAAEALQKNHLISYSRGNIKVQDRQGLRAASCQCYQTMTDFYQRVMD